MGIQLILHISIPQRITCLTDTIQTASWTLRANPTTDAPMAIRNVIAGGNS